MLRWILALICLWSPECKCSYIIPIHGPAWTWKFAVYYLLTAWATWKSNVMCISHGRIIQVHVRWMIKQLSRIETHVVFSSIKTTLWNLVYRVKLTMTSYDLDNWVSLSAARRQLSPVKLLILNYLIIIHVWCQDHVETSLTIIGLYM